jgi:glycosyltransferase involved in cell wall biosynthesis
MHRRIKTAPPNVHFPGFVKDIAAAYSACDSLFFTPYTENQPMVILESAALGLPLVLREIPEYEGFLTDGENCLLCRDNDEFAENLAKVASEKALREKLRKGALELSEEHDLMNVGDHLKRLYGELIEAAEVGLPAI